ncbi:MAG: bifunctional riboflavin kinase/FAD synthetase [Phycisphaerae bacterium]
MLERCIFGIENVPESLERCALTIGKFDGVHRGHQAIIGRAIELGRNEGIPAIALTFEPPPEMVLRPDSASPRICSPERKVELLLQTGLDSVCIAHASRELFSMSPQQFIDDVLVDTFHVRHIVEGDNFFFGSKRSGNVDTLRQAGQELGFDTHVVRPKNIELEGDMQRISSSLVRSLVAEGRVQDAAHCLGRLFELEGTVVRGRGRGRGWSFPTANLDTGEHIVPKDGVYAGWAELAGTDHPAAISIGCNPTVGGTERVVEAFLLDTEGHYYEQSMTLKFMEYLRPQERFESEQLLRAQIAKDVARVRELCDR